MKSLLIKSTKKTLSVNCQDGKISFEGCSLLNHPKVFFKPIENWLDEYFVQKPNKTVFDFNLEYIDSPTTKHLYQILNLSADKLGRSTIEVNWYYNENDPEMMELGEIMQSKLRLNFNFIDISRYKNKSVVTE